MIIFSCNTVLLRRYGTIVNYYPTPIKSNFQFIEWIIISGSTKMHIRDYIINFFEKIAWFMKTYRNMLHLEIMMLNCLILLI